MVPQITTYQHKYDSNDPHSVWILFVHKFGSPRISERCSPFFLCELLVHHFFIVYCAFVSTTLMQWVVFIWYVRTSINRRWLSSWSWSAIWSLRSHIWLSICWQGHVAAYTRRFNRWVVRCHFLFTLSTNSLVFLDGCHVGTCTSCSHF